MKLITKTLMIISTCLMLSQVDAQVQGSLNFNGQDNYVEVLDSPINVIDDGDFTFEAWIKGLESEQVSHPMVFSNRSNDSFGGGMLVFFHDIWGGSQSKILSIQIDGNNHKFVNNGTFNGSLLDNKCHHIAITRSGTTLSFYADGNLFGQTNPALATIANSSSFWIGMDKATGNSFNGIISQCRIWTVARTQEEIDEAKDMVLEGDESGLLAYWEMNNEESQTVSDKTGQYNGILGSSEEEDNQDPMWSEDGCIQAPVSINESEDIFVNVSPNPTSGLLTINNPGNEVIQFSLVNQIGKLLFSRTSYEGASTIDISDYANGIYFLNVNYNNQSYTQKIVKN